MLSVQAGLGAFGFLLLWACNRSKKEADLQTPLFLPVELISVLFHCGIAFTVYNLSVMMLTVAFFVCYVTSELSFISNCPLRGTKGSLNSEREDECKK